MTRIWRSRERPRAPGAAATAPLGVVRLGHVLRFEPGTQRIVGLTVLDARRLLERDGRLIVTVPEKAEASADELAPALAAA